MKQPGDLDARSRALYGAWLGGVSLGAVGMALHHKLCHTLGGTFNLPHAETHTVVLPHAVAYNAAAAPEAMDRIARALGARFSRGGLVRSGCFAGRTRLARIFGDAARATGSGRRSRRSESLLQSAPGHAGGNSRAARRRLRGPPASRRWCEVMTADPLGHHEPFSLRRAAVREEKYDRNVRGLIQTPRAVRCVKGPSSLVLSRAAASAKPCVSRLYSHLFAFRHFPCIEMAQRDPK